MSIISWKSFDASRPNPELEKVIKELSDRILVAKNVNKADMCAVISFAEGEISNYESGSNSEANRTVGIDIFRPHEFDSILANDDSLNELGNWLQRQQFDWRKGSRTVQVALDASFTSAGSRSVEGGRESVILDNLVIIKGRRVAIEIEISTNLDNGYWTLRQALLAGMADYGVMIVPWTPRNPGRAEEGMALARLDREFDGRTSAPDGPIYRLAIIKLIDVYRSMLKDYIAQSART